jgi:hypothetical protein
MVSLSAVALSWAAFVAGVQPIGFRWTQHLRLQPAVETDRFVRHYESMAHAPALARQREGAMIAASRPTSRTE